MPQGAEALREVEALRERKLDIAIPSNSGARRQILAAQRLLVLAAQRLASEQVMDLYPGPSLVSNLHVEHR